MSANFSKVIVPVWVSFVFNFCLICHLQCTILVRMDDKMNRQLSTIVDETDTPFDLANELIYHGFINEA